MAGGAVRAHPRPAQPGGEEVEPGLADGARGRPGGGSPLLLRNIGGGGRVPVPLHGRRAGSYPGDSPDVRRRGARPPYVAAAAVGARVEGVHGDWVREARVGRTRHRIPLRAVAQGVHVRRVCSASCSSGDLSLRNWPHFSFNLNIFAWVFLGEILVRLMSIATSKHLTRKLDLLISRENFQLKHLIYAFCGV